MTDGNKQLALFQGKSIRRVIFNDEWWFSILDIISILTDSPQPKTYWAKMKDRDQEMSQPFPFWEQLKMIAEDGKMCETDCANTEGILRIIQSVPSSKAEPFKRWLSKVGYERIQEIEDPELATKRTKELYKSKGYSDVWIEKRMRGIAVREELTDEWKKRGVKENVEFSILTAEISKATFGMTPSEYKKHKRLKRENLRDHMTDLELIFSMLGEASTTKIARDKNALGFIENKVAAQKGGKIAGDARKNLELVSGKKIVTKDNYLLKALGKKKGKK